MSRPLVPGSALVCPPARMAEGGREGKNPNPSDLADSVTMRTAAGRVIVRRVSEEVKERRRQTDRQAVRQRKRLAWSSTPAAICYLGLIQPLAPRTTFHCKRNAGEQPQGRRRPVSHVTALTHPSARRCLVLTEAPRRNAT